MKKYKPELNEYFKKVLTYKGHEIFDVEHSIDRYTQRFDITGEYPDLYFNLLKKGIDWVIKNNKENIEDRYIFISKKHGFGIQVHWREDRFTKEYNGYTATTFSNDEMNFFTKADKKVFLENCLPHQVIGIEKGIYYNYKFKNELKEETDLVNLDMFIEEGKVYHTYQLIKL